MTSEIARLPTITCARVLTPESDAVTLTPFETASFHALVVTHAQAGHLVAEEAA